MLKEEKEDVPLSYFYVKVDHFLTTKPFLHDEGDFADYLLFLRWKSGFRKTYKVDNLKVKELNAR